MAIFVKSVLLYFVSNWKLYFFTVVPVEIQAILQGKKNLQKLLNESHHVCKLSLDSSYLSLALWGRSVGHGCKPRLYLYISAASTWIPNRQDYCFVILCTLHLWSEFWNRPNFLLKKLHFIKETLLVLFFSISCDILSLSHKPNSYRRI